MRARWIRIVASIATLAAIALAGLVDMPELNEILRGMPGDSWMDRIARSVLRSGRVPVDPPRNVGWSVTGKLTDGNRTNKVQLQCQFQQQMQVHTIQFDGPNNDIVLPSNRILAAEAEILWAVEGTTIRRYVTVQDGLAISGNAQSVTVNVSDATRNSVTGTEYTVGVTVTPGPRPTYNVPPVYYPHGLLASTPSGTPQGSTVPVPSLDAAVYTIPPDIGAVSAFLTAIPNTAATAIQQNDLRAAFSTVNGSLTDAGVVNYDFFGKWIPLPATTRTVEITNTSAMTIRVQCVIGIQG